MNIFNSGSTCRGFTLIELIIIVAVIAILAAIAIPKYLTLTQEARQATAESYANAMASASAVNHAVCHANRNNPNCVKEIKSCTEFKKLLSGGTFPVGLTIENNGVFPSESGGVANCVVYYGKENRAEFRATVP